ncbi:CsgG/HfaB family protein [Maridesulfovibrio sp.]|uniref:CsgG/HfaB family protein n=1 Tax=Maridesulfovibrio sp. TaxID=2795000 RepID=UPI0029F4ECC5|nr:CsgG/HfaB family protein [Maridesulfovibrio sp.]
MRLLLQVLLIPLITFCLSTNVAFAKLNYVTINGHGTGVTPKEAVQSALIEALGKVNGMQMASKERTALSSVKFTAEVLGKKGAAELNSEQFQQEIQTATKGLIKSYEVLSLEPDKYTAGLIAADLKVTVVKYAVSKQANRNRIAVLPFRVDNVKDPLQAVFAKNLCQGLVSYLTQTRRFAVLDRDFQKESSVELDSLRSADVPVEEMARLGNRLGADFIIVGQINKAVSQQWNKEMKSTGKKFPMSRYGAALTYRVMDVATGQILASQLYDGIKTHQGAAPDMSSIAKAYASTIGNKIVEGIFPLMVVSVSGKTMYLGQGGETIKKGQKFSLIQYGKRMVDPYTKESLGREEIPVGVIQVTDVQAKTSRANILKCSVDINSVFAPNTFIVRPIKGSGGMTPTTAKVKKVEKAVEKSMEDMEKESSDDW